jgi:lysophospholipase L1-like esterase
MAGHVVLLGDSILDNGAYVGRDPAVVDQVRAELPAGWSATLLAVDGSVTRDVARQLARLPADPTHLVVSVGGNDALGASGLLLAPARPAAVLFADLADVRDRFERDYAAMLDAVQARRRPTVVCTVYDGHAPDPWQQRVRAAGLTAFNDVILRAAVRRRLPVLDLRVLFDAPADYANPIEPSAAGGRKIARLVREVVTKHDFARGVTAVYA